METRKLNLLPAAGVPTLSTILERVGPGLDPVTLLDPAAYRAARAAWSQFRTGAGFRSYGDLLTLPQNQKKLAKSETYSIGLTLASGDAAGVELCPWRTATCSALCVGYNGNGRYQMTQHARIVKSQFAAAHPVEFLTLLAGEIATQVAKARANDPERVVAVRLNINSDLRFYKIVPQFFTGELFGAGVVFYDYTKNPAILAGTGYVGKVYRLTYSLNENSNLDRVSEFLSRGGSVAAVTNRRKTTPAASAIELDGVLWPAVDGDVTDERFNDPAGVIVDLAAKGHKFDAFGDFLLKAYA